MLTEVDFTWTGQIAQFTIEGSFSFNENEIGLDGVANTGELESLEVSFFSPDGDLLQTYSENHLDAGVNFNYDVEVGEILQDGVFDAPDGLNVGDGTRSDGWTFWSKPFEAAIPHLHVDDWQDEFGFPIGFSSHEDVGFFALTTQQLVDSGRVGDAYLSEITSDPARLEETGARIETTPVDERTAPFVPNFNSFTDDVIELEGSGELVFAGGGGDLVDASVGSDGGNRVYLGGGDDIALLGQGDRFVGGTGDDSFFALENGDNVLTGGEGADQFWITTGDFLRNVFELSASDGYYTFAGNVSGNSDIRLLSDKATIIGFPGFDTNSFLNFEDIPVDKIDDVLLSATLELEHAAALGEVANLIPATEDRPVNVGVYGLDEDAEFDPIDGNDDDIDFGVELDSADDEGEDDSDDATDVPEGPDFTMPAPNVVDTATIGADGVYEWDVTSLLEAEPDTDELDVALSGVFGNENIDDRNSYAAFYPVGASDGLAPKLTIEAEGINTITDFTSGTDVIGLAGFDVTFDDIELVADGENTLVGLFGNEFALLEGVAVDELSVSDFFIA